MNFELIKADKMSNIKKPTTEQSTNSKGSGDIVVSTNKYLNAYHDLTKNEMRVIEMAVVDARETDTGLSTDKPLKLYIKDFATRFDITWESAYEAILEASKSFMKGKSYAYPHPRYPDDPRKNITSHYVQDFAPIIDEGYFELTFTRSVVDEVSRIDGKNMPYTEYFLTQTAKMDSVYSIRLFQMLSAWRKTLADSGKPTPIYELRNFRYQLGIADEEYDAMSDFKKRVLEKATTEINKLTDMSVDYVQVKKGRKIIGFKFILKNKNMKLKDVTQLEDNDETKYFYKFASESQANFIASQLAVIHELVGNSSYRTTQEAIEAIHKELLDRDKQQKYIPYIEKLPKIKLKKVEC